MTSIKKDGVFDKVREKIREESDFLFRVTGETRTGMSHIASGVARMIDAMKEPFEKKDEETENIENQLKQTRG